MIFGVLVSKSQFLVFSIFCTGDDFCQNYKSTITKTKSFLKTSQKGKDKKVPLEFVYFDCFVIKRYSSHQISSVPNEIGKYLNVVMIIWS